MESLKQRISQLLRECKEVISESNKLIDEFHIGIINNLPISESDNGEYRMIEGTPLREIPSEQVIWLLTKLSELWISGEKTAALKELMFVPVFIEGLPSLDLSYLYFRDRFDISSKIYVYDINFNCCIFADGVSFDNSEITARIHFNNARFNHTVSFNDVKEYRGKLKISGCKFSRGIMSTNFSI